MCDRNGVLVMDAVVDARKVCRVCAPAQISNYPGYRASLTTIYHQSSCLGSKDPKSMARNRTRDPNDLGAVPLELKGGYPYPCSATMRTFS